MAKDKVLFAGLFALGFAVIGAMWLSETRGASAQSHDDTGGPYLVIEVAGGAEGEVVIDLDDDAAPGHVERIVTLAEDGAYDDVVFHRVIDGFMAQTGDVEHGRRDGDLSRAGTGGSDMQDLAAEFSDRSFARGAVGMSRSADPNSANSQFFIMFDDAPHLDGDYTVVGHVLEGMEIVDAITRVEPQGDVAGTADFMARVTVRD